VEEEKKQTAVTIEPYFDRMVVEKDPVQTHDKVGMLIPETARKPSNTGTIIAVGPDVKFAKEGDRIVFNYTSGVEIIVANTKYVLMRESEIYAKVNNYSPVANEDSAMPTGNLATSIR
jgi:co-chaperonin GroES (HSP10)